MRKANVPLVVLSATDLSGKVTRKRCLNVPRPIFLMRGLKRVRIEGRQAAMRCIPGSITVHITVSVEDK